MLQTETKKINKKSYLHNYSDAGMLIMQDETGDLYEDAIDPVDSGRTYTETDIPIEDEEEA